MKDYTSSSHLGLIRRPATTLIIPSHAVKALHDVFPHQDSVLLPHKVLHGHNMIPKQCRKSVPHRTQPNQQCWSSIPVCHPTETTHTCELSHSALRQSDTAHSRQHRCHCMAALWTCMLTFFLGANQPCPEGSELRPHRGMPAPRPAASRYVIHALPTGLTLPGHVPAWGSVSRVHMLLSAQDG